MGHPWPWQKEAARSLGRTPEEVFRAIPVEEWTAAMQAQGVEKAVLTVRLDRPAAEIVKLAEDHPDRFVLSALVDPRQGMKALRALDSLARQTPLKLARVIPCTLGVGPDDRCYYPLYARCIDLGLPLSVNTGIPGPPLPARWQDPILLDEVCLFFPELVLIMAHGADPWWEVAIRLMLRHPNLYLMTSAYAPRYLPDSLLHFMNTRGPHKVMFATDFPFLTWERCLAEALALPLKPESLQAYLYENACRLFFAS